MSRRTVSRSPSPRSRSPKPEYDAGDDVVNNTPNDEVPLTPTRSRTPSRSPLSASPISQGALSASVLGGAALGATALAASSPILSSSPASTSVRTGAVSRSPVVSRSRSRSLREEDPEIVDEELDEEQPGLVSSVLIEEPVAASPKLSPTRGSASASPLRTSRSSPSSPRTSPGPSVVSSSPSAVSPSPSPSSSTVDDYLLKKGYTPLPQGKVIVKDSLKYVKAYDLYGNVVYVEIDELNPAILIGQHDLTYIETVPTETPLEEVLTRAEGIQLSVPGVVYECQDGVCTIRREAKTYDLKAVLYNKVASCSMTVVTPGGRRLSALPHVYDGKSALPYPIVRLSDIEINPVAVRQNTETACLRLRNRLLYEEEKKIMIFKKKLELFYQKSLEALNDLSIARASFIKKADLHKKKLTEIKPVCEKTSAAYLAHLKEAHECQCLFEKSFDSSYTYTRIHEGLEERTLEIQKLQSSLVDLAAPYL